MKRLLMNSCVLAVKLFKVLNNFGCTSNTLKTKGRLKCSNERCSSQDKARQTNKHTNVSFVADDQTDEESLRRFMEMQSRKKRLS